MESHVRRSDDSDIFQHTPNSSHEHLKRQKDARSTRAFRGIKWYWKDFSGPFDPFGPWLGLEAHDSALEGFRQRAEKQLRSTENFPEEVLVEDAATMAPA